MYIISRLCLFFVYLCLIFDVEIMINTLSFSFQANFQSLTPRFDSEDSICRHLVT